MALITKNGNQIRKIYAPEMDISRSSLLSISNDISAITSNARSLYRYDNKLEDYDMDLLTYGDTVADLISDVYFKVPATQRQYYTKNYVRKSLFYNNNQQVTKITYHEQKYATIHKPDFIDIDFVNKTLTNNGSTDFVLPVRTGMETNNNSVQESNTLPEGVEFTIITFDTLRLYNTKENENIAVSGTYNLGDSIRIDLPSTTLLPLVSTDPLPFTEHKNVFDEINENIFTAGSTTDITDILVNSDMTTKKAEEFFVYDDKNRLIKQWFDNFVD